MNTLRDALRSEELTLTAELTLTPRDAAGQVVDQAKLLAKSAAAVQIPDHRHARPHMSNLAVASLLKDHGIAPIVHMNCRDRNRIALQSDMLGAVALGVRNLLLSRGTPLPEDHRPKTTAVFDVGAIDLIATAAAIRDGEVFVGDASTGAGDLYIGTVATAFEPPADWEPEKLTSKADAGAQFIQLQICHDLDLLRAYAARIVASRLTWRLQLLGALAVIPSAEAGRELRKARPDSIIPAAVIRRIEQGRDPEAEGVAIAAEQLQLLAEIPGISGVTLSTPGDPALVPAAVAAAGLRP